MPGEIGRLARPEELEVLELTSRLRLQMRRRRVACLVDGAPERLSPPLERLLLSPPPGEVIPSVAGLRQDEETPIQLLVPE